jgi:hypothetical protein
VDETVEAMGGVATVVDLHDEARLPSAREATATFPACPMHATTVVPDTTMTTAARTALETGTVAN